jgi:hypothetical protein
MTPVEWSALISSVAVLLAASGSALLTLRITGRTIANDNDQRGKDRESQLKIEYNLRLYENRVRVGIAYLEYLHERNTTAVHCLSLAASNRAEEIEPNAFGGLFSDAPMAGVSLFMPFHIREGAFDIEEKLQAIAAAIGGASQPPTPSDMELFKTSLETFAAEQKSIWDALAVLFQQPAASEEPSTPPMAGES